MHLFSAWPPLPEEAILSTFQAILTRAAQPNHGEYWRVAEYVYPALAMESRAQTTQGVLSRSPEEERSAEWLDATLTQALRVVNSLGDAAEAWWQVRDALGATRWCMRQQAEDSSWLTPLALEAQEHYGRVQACYRRALGEILVFAQAHEATLRFPLEHPFADMRFNRWQERQQHDTAYDT